MAFDWNPLSWVYGRHGLVGPEKTADIKTPKFIQQQLDPSQAAKQWSQLGQQFANEFGGVAPWAQLGRGLLFTPEGFGLGAPSLPKKKAAAAGGGQQQPAAQTTPQQQTIFDPLNMQTLFSTVFAPYLNQVAQQYSDQIGQYGSAMNAALAKPMDPGIRAAMQAQVPQEQAAMMNENQALQGLAIAQPEFQSLLSNLNLARQAAYTQAKAVANYNALNATGALGLTPQQLNNPNTKVSPLQQMQLNTLGLTG